MKEVKRALVAQLREDLRYSPAVGILGPRQVGKTTLAKQLAADLPHEWFDAQRPSDRKRLQQAELLFPILNDRLVIIDEVQLVPELFGWLRPIIDEKREPGRFLLLGSASPELIKGSSESLAGRISYSELSCLGLLELEGHQVSMNEHLLTGGFPEPLLAMPPHRRNAWFNNFIRTYINKDLSEIGINVRIGDFERLISMVAHSNGGLFNASAFARSLSITNDTVRKYIDILAQSFLIRILPPWLPNAKKRIVKSPRLFIRDAGLLHYFLNVSDFNVLLGHISLGASWEGYVIEEICKIVGANATPYFYRTAKGAELDLVLDYRSHRIAFECKFSNAPSLSKGFYSAIEDVEPKTSYIVTPSSKRYETKSGAIVIGLTDLLKELSSASVVD